MNEPHEYIWDAERHLYRRGSTAPFLYSDGAEFEQRLLQLMRGVADRSVFSQDLRRAITDWPSEYHLSRQRHCLVRPLNIKPGESVLEVGAGCGAITRYLGELGAKVTAVEGSLSRATIASERCRELANVKVVSDDLLHFDTRDSFDWLLLIGVLEYAPVFSSADAPAQHYLTSLKRFLAPGGSLVVAIENKLGLKYFNGCGEDHVGVPFFGIQNLYGNRSPRTYGRSELVSELSLAGFPFSRFYYPFPDYKLPSVILSEEALQSKTFHSVDLLLRSRARDYTGNPLRVFNEALVSRALADNALLDHFANSFLVVASQESLPANRSRDLATTYATGRQPQFSTVTRFFHEGEETRVRKEFLVSRPSREAVTESGMQFRLSEESATYVQGRPLFLRFLMEQARNAPFETLVSVLQPWVHFLLNQAKRAESGAPGELASFTIDGRLLDCTPFNLMEDRATLIQIDREWSSERDLSLGWVVTRSLLHCFREGVASVGVPNSLTEIIQAVVSPAGLATSEQDVLRWLAAESDFQEAVTGSEFSVFGRIGPDVLPAMGQVHELTALLERNTAELSRFRQESASTLAHLQEALSIERAAVEQATLERDILAAELIPMKRSLSWRLTVPLRFVKHRLRQLRNAVLSKS